MDTGRVSEYSKRDRVGSFGLVFGSKLSTTVFASSVFSKAAAVYDLTGGLFLFALERDFLGERKGALSPQTFSTLQIKRVVEVFVWNGSNQLQEFADVVR